MADGRSPLKRVGAALGGLLLVVVAGYLGIDQASDQASDRGSAQGPTENSGMCALDSLPAEAEETAEDINAGGPYEFPDNDNQRFGNYEGVLPARESGYYREYTVVTPGLSHRGARRIITGGGTEEDPETWYYTDDHYESFCEIPDADT